MEQGQPEAPRWAPEPYALRRGADFEARLLEELAAFGHQLAVLAQFVPSCGADRTGEELLTTVKQVQTTTQLLGSIRATCAESCDVEPQVVLPIPPYIALHRPTSPCIALHLPASPCISLHLPASPCLELQAVLGDYARLMRSTELTLARWRRST